MQTWYSFGLHNNSASPVILRSIDPPSCRLPVNPYDAICPSAPDWNPSPITEAEAIGKVADGLCKSIFRASQKLLVSVRSDTSKYVFHECGEMDFLTEL